MDDGVDAEDVSEALAEEVKRFSEIHLRLKTQLEAAEEELRTTRSTAEKSSIEKKDLQMHLVVAKDEAKIKHEESKAKITELQKLLAAVQQVSSGMGFRREPLTSSVYLMTSGTRSSIRQN